MKPFVVYDAAGTILRTGYCQDHVIPHQAAPGQYAMEGNANVHKDVVFQNQVMTKEDARASGWQG